MHSDFVDGLVSFTSFEYPFDAKGIDWLQRKTKAADLVEYVMVKRSPSLDATCNLQFAICGKRHVRHCPRRVSEISVNSLPTPLDAKFARMAFINMHCASLRAW